MMVSHEVWSVFQLSLLSSLQGIHEISTPLYSKLSKMVSIITVFNVLMMGKLEWKHLCCNILPYQLCLLS